MADLAWHTPDTARAAFNVNVTAAGLVAAREQCLRVRGLPLDLTDPPTASFAQGVVYQALANKQATQVGATGLDEYGSENATVALRPLDGKIMSLLIIPDPVYGEDGETVIGDRGRVASMIG